MKIGQIIRRKAMDNFPIGPYLRIKYIELDRVYADTIGWDNPNIILLKKNIYIPTNFTLLISQCVLDKLNSGALMAVQHPATTRWIQALEKSPEIITFQSFPLNYKHTFVVEQITEHYSFGEKMIRINVANKIV